MLHNASTPDNGFSGANSFVFKFLASMMPLEVTDVMELKYGMSDGTSGKSDFEFTTSISLNAAGETKSVSRQPFTLDRQALQLSYFAQADQIAEEAKQNWHLRPLQEYSYNQVENPLRWYTLAQDIQMT